MDDILDLMEDVAEVIQLYDVTQVTPEAIELARICEACCERVHAAVSKLHDMKNAKDILRISTEIDMLESDADRVMRSAISQLFRNENDFKRLMKLKAWERKYSGESLPNVSLYSKCQKHEFKEMYGKDSTFFHNERWWTSRASSSNVNLNISSCWCYVWDKHMGRGFTVD